MKAEHDLQPALPFGDPSATDFPGHSPGRLGSRPVPAAPTVSRVRPRPGDATPMSLLCFAARWHAADPVAAMKAAAARLRHQTGQNRAPYALTPMLRLLSARRADSSGGRAHGRLHASHDGWTVYRRTDMVWRRIRFTEAHEIAHILIYQAIATNKGALDDLHRPETHQYLERLCDLGATELLVPSDELDEDLRDRRLDRVDDYTRIYDRYLVSHLTLMRRFSEVLPNTALTAWTWRNHPRGADWRISSSYTVHLGSIYIPTGLSRRRLTPDVVTAALADGVASAAGTLDVGSRRFDASMTAVRPLFRPQTELPIYQGRSIRDEPADETVYVLHRDVSSAAVRRPRFPRRRTPTTPP